MSRLDTRRRQHPIRRKEHATNRRPKLFSLVNPGNTLDVFAVGIDLDDEAVTYRTGNQFGVHNSAEGARRSFSRITELRLVWEEGWEDEPMAA